MPKGPNIQSLPPSPPLGAEGKLRVAKQGEGGVYSKGSVFTPPAPPTPLPLKGVRGVSGEIPAKFDQYRAQDAFGVCHHLAVAKADDAETFALDKFRPASVVSLAPSMAVSVQLDDKTVLSGCKVGDIIRAKDHLADEFDAFQSAAAQQRPEFFLRRRHFGTQPFRISPVRSVALDQVTPPSPWRRCASPFPLPLKGARDISELKNAQTY